MENFSFIDPKILETLAAAKKNGTEFIGSASSDFQSHPYLRDKKHPRTDWEMQIHKLVKNQSSKILGEQNISEFPNFLKRKSCT